MFDILFDVRNSYLKLSDLSRKIEAVIKQSFGSESYWIVAEISRHKFYRDEDRHYFDFGEKLEGLTVNVFLNIFKSKKEYDEIVHIIPLKKGGCDCPSNMQWQTKEAAKEKDKWEAP